MDALTGEHMPSQYDARTKPSLETLPVEIFGKICTFLNTNALSKIALTSRALYLATQSPLYRHITIHSIQVLFRLVRTLNGLGSAASDPDNARSWYKQQTKTKDVLTANITVEGSDSGPWGSPTAVLVSGLIRSLVNHAPEIRITLSLVKSSCSCPFLRGCIGETFPRVTKLVLYVGKHHHTPQKPEKSSTALNSMLSPASGARRTAIPRPPERQRCLPSGSFWDPFLNGRSFQDCRSIEIHHYWAEPSSTKILPLDGLLEPDVPWSPRGTSYEVTDAYLGRLNRRRITGSTSLSASDSFGGLQKFEEFTVEGAPELTEEIMGTIMENKGSIATNLKRLDLRGLQSLTLRAVAKLLARALPTLTHFTLHIGPQNSDAVEHRSRFQSNARYEKEYLERGEIVPHLCPLIRDFGKDVQQLELAVPYVCRQIFITNQESDALEQAGVQIKIGVEPGITPSLTPLDCRSISKVILGYRNQSALHTRQRNIEATVLKAGNSQVGMNSRAATNAGIEYDIQVEDRTRRLREANIPWKRTIIAWDGLCSDEHTWEELTVEADLEEEHVEWTLANYAIPCASRHNGGRTLDQPFWSDVTGKDTRSRLE